VAFALGVKPRLDLEEIYREHREEVFGFLLRFLGDRSLAEDALQESFYRLVRAADRFDPARPLRPWLHQIVRNVALDALRMRRREPRGPKSAEPASSAKEPLAALAHGEAAALARAALDALPDETRLLLLQRHGLDMKVLELAEVWGVSERTMRYRLEAAGVELAATILEQRRGGRS